MKLDELKQIGKGYGSLQLAPDNIKSITKVLNELDIDNIITDMHITLIYDTSNPTTDIKTDSKAEYSASITGAEALGEPGTKWYAIALTLKSPEIDTRHKDYIDAGFKHSYPEFVPHLSLKYKPSEQDINTIQDNISKFKKMELIFTGESLRPIKE